MPTRKRATTKAKKEKKPFIKIPDLPPINWPALEEKIHDVILDQAPKVLPGAEKMALAVNNVAKWLDDQVDFSALGIAGAALEAADGPILKFLIKGLVQRAYDQLKIEGQV